MSSECSGVQERERKLCAVGILLGVYLELQTTSERERERVVGSGGGGCSFMILGGNSSIDLICTPTNC